MSKLAEKIAKEIAEAGIIPFARFMELALYCPEYGFYEKERDRIGKQGDYFTSVSVGPLFGELLASQFAEWMGANEVRGEKGDGRMQLIEGGGHDGRLACDILNWFKKERPDLLSRIKYLLIEPSRHRCQWQKETLKDFHGLVSWVPGLDSLPLGAEHHRIIFSNELLDSMPVHRLVWDASMMRWFERGITVRDGEFEWARMPSEKAQPIWGSHALLFTDHDLADGFILDLCPAAERWWEAAARALSSGKLLTLDYGLTSEEMLAPERRNGTLRSYHQHHISSDALANPGEQDLTAHVNFTGLQAIGETAGLRTECMVTQEQFLTRIVEKAFKGTAQLSSWTELKTRQLKTLTHPNIMGQQFRVLVQVRE